MVTFEGVYQKKYLNILECSFLLNLGLLSALAAVFQNDDNSERVVTIISISVALATFIGVLFFHVHLRVKKKLSLVQEMCCQKWLRAGGV